MGACKVRCLLVRGSGTDLYVAATEGGKIGFVTMAFAVLDAGQWMKREKG